MITKNNDNLNIFPARIEVLTGVVKDLDLLGCYGVSFGK
jgi:hypothetical protein